MTYLEWLKDNPRPPRKYAANQYGCHSDGRCLDDDDQWCEEDEYYPDEEYGDPWCH